MLYSLGGNDKLSTTFSLKTKPFFITLHY